MRYWLFILLLQSFAGLAQTADSILTTIQLQDVHVYGMPVSKYAAGSTIRNVSQHEGQVVLNDALQDAPSVYFKTYGNGQLSTIAFRGTNASHTAVLWNGVNINSPSLGLTDFSLLPLFLLEDIALQYGTSSSLYGSDALGGTVLLNMALPSFRKAASVMVQQDVGSFGNYSSGLKVSLSGSRWEWRTKVMRRSIENDFPFYSPAVGYRRVQQHASVRQAGVDQQVHYRLSTKATLSLEVLHTWNFREIQPPVTNYRSDETLRDENTRVNVSYRGRHAMGDVHASATYIDNWQAYAANPPSRTRQFNGLINADRSLGALTDVRYGISTTWFVGDNENYFGQIQESRHDAFVSLTHGLSHRARASANLRQSLYNGRTAPFTPSLGLEYIARNKGDHTGIVKFQASRGFRVPTLNDRYWTPGGNPDLRPENAWQIEGGVDWNYRKKNSVLSGGVTAYHIWVDQWILWQPGERGFWSPANLQHVNAYGAEAAIRYRYKTGEVMWETQGQYSFTRSENLRAASPADQHTVGSQLPYVPHHLANISSSVHYRSWSLGGRGEYTGLRFTTLDNVQHQSLPGYWLAHAFVRREYEWLRYRVSARAAVNNIFNTYFELIQNRAMPGRNYSISVIFYFNQTNKPAVQP